MTPHQLPDVLQRGIAIFLFSVGVGLVTTHVLLVALAAQRSSLAQSKKVAATAVVGACLIVWLGIAMTLGDRTNFPIVREDLRLPITLVVAFGPVFLGIAALFAMKALRAVNAAMPPSWLIWLQIYRIAGFIFLYPYLYYGIVPASFAIPAALGDFLTGALAPPVALAVARRRSHAITWAIAWNLFGILDLTVAPMAAVLSHASLIGLYPLSLVGLFIGPPMGILAHVYSIRNLRASRSQAAFDGASTLVDHRGPIENALRTTYPPARLG